VKNKEGLCDSQKDPIIETYLKTIDGLADKTVELECNYRGFLKGLGWACVMKNYKKYVGEAYDECCHHDHHGHDHGHGHGPHGPRRGSGHGDFKQFEAVVDKK